MLYLLKLEKFSIRLKYKPTEIQLDIIQLFAAQNAYVYLTYYLASLFEGHKFEIWL